MECDHLQGTMIDAAAGLAPCSPEFKCHLKTCPKCSDQFHVLCKTLGLLDEWKGPEPSSRFDAVLRARLREADALDRTRWWSRWLQPVVAIGFATLLVAGTLVVQRTTHLPVRTPVTYEWDVIAQPGSAVGDLQSLQEADELLTDFDLLDELAPVQSNSSRQD